MPPPNRRDPWPALARAGACRVQVFYPSSGGALAVRHEGEGRVEVVAGDSEVTWQERGRWTRGELAGLAFHNAVRWRRTDGPGLEVSHLRRGADRPTFLVELLPGPGGWSSATPHLCGADRYHARLTWSENDLTLEWEVASPTDPYTLRWTTRLR